MDIPLTVWLWPEQGQVRGWMPDRSRLFATATPGPRPLSHRTQRDGLEVVDLRQGVHPELADFLGTALATGRAPQLRLARGLPEAWREFPYEQLVHAGRPLAGQLSVAREVPFPSEMDTALPALGTVVFDLWPRDEAIRPAQELRDFWPSLEIANSKRQAERFFVSHNPHNYGLLIVVAHGTEGQCEAPFRLSDGSTWSLPRDRGLPALVILLACGGEDGNLLNYAQTLLAAGARTVLAPRGQLDARGATVFLHGFLRDWFDQGLSVAEALRRAQLKDTSERYGAQRLYLLGEPGLRWGLTDAPDYTPTATLETRAREELQGDGPPTALVALCERLTLREYQRNGDVDALHRQLPFAKTEESALLQRLYPTIQSLPALTRRWLLPFLGYLAEDRDHTLINLITKLRLHFEQDHPEDWPPASYHHWAKLYYRRGKYPCAAREAITGLTRIPSDQLSQQGTGLLGILLNVLIDQALVGPARAVEQRLCECTGERYDEQVEEIEFKLIDRRARLALRAGHGERAHALYRRRYQTDNTDERALPWLLYITAWYPLAQGREYRDAALALLETEQDVWACVGNDALLYRWRTLAAWAWLRNDAEVADAITPVIPLCGKRLSDHPLLDAGPPAFTLAYLKLYAQQYSPVWREDLPPWGDIAEALWKDRYFLELAIFAALGGERAEAMSNLKTYQQQRRSVARELARLPDHLALPDWTEELSEREALERAGLLDSGIPSPDSLARQGLLPL